MMLKTPLIFFVLISCLFFNPSLQSTEHTIVGYDFNDKTDYKSWSEWSHEKVSYAFERAQYVFNNIILNTVVYACGGAGYVLLFGKPQEMSKNNLKRIQAKYFIMWIAYSVASGGVVRFVHACMKDSQNKGVLSHIPDILPSQSLRKATEIATMTLLSLCSKNEKMPLYALITIGSAGFLHSGHTLSKQDIKTDTPVFDTFFSKEYLPIACSIFRGSLKELIASFESENLDISRSAHIKAFANAIVGSFKKINDFGLNTKTYGHAPLLFSLFENTLIEFVAPFLTIPLQSYLEDSSMDLRKNILLIFESFS